MQSNNSLVDFTCWVLSMDALISRVQEHRSVRSKTLQTFVKNLGAPCCVIVFVKGKAINCKRCLAEHAEIVHKYSSNCGF